MEKLAIFTLRVHSFLKLSLVTILLGLLIGIGCAEGGLLVRQEGREDIIPNLGSSVISETSSSPVISTKPKAARTSPVLSEAVTMKPKPKFKGPESNCASAFDPCYFPRSTCCKWQTECSWELSPDDCKTDKDKDDFCCKYM